MKKTLFSIILMGLGATLFVSAAESPRKRTSQEIFDKYGKIAQEEYQKLEKSENHSDQQKKALIDQNRKEWEERDSAWKKQESGILLQREDNKSQKDLLNSKREILDNTRQGITNLTSWSPRMLYQRLMDRNYQKKLSDLRKIYESAEKIYVSDLYNKTRQEYREEEALFNTSNVPAYVQSSINESKLEPSQLIARKEIINFSKTCFKHKTHLYAFVRSSGLKKQDQQLFHEYRQQQLKE